MVYPISQGRLINVAVFEADYNREGTVYPEPWITTEVDTQKVIESFRGWEQEVQELIGVRIILHILCVIPRES